MLFNNTFMAYLNNGIKEGVGDKYFAKKTGEESPEDKFNRDYSTHIEERKIIGYITTSEYGGRLKKPVPIIKNPSNPNSMINGTRGIITKIGDLYVEGAADALNKLVHADLLMFLSSKGIINKNYDDWEDIWNKKDFVGIQLEDGYWGISQSYLFSGEDDPKRENETIMFEPFFIEVKNKIPSFKYILKKVNDLDFGY
jgi:hypothetical protein